MTGEDGSDDLAEGIVGVSEYEAPSPTKKEFSAWHRPRKQFVRGEQWCVQIEKMLDECAELSLDNGTLRYCGLPGTDLLDLRCFHESICVPRSIKLQYLGFNSAAAPDSKEQIELNISIDEVNKLTFVDPVSEVIPDDIRAVANLNSIAWAKLAKFGPFDVVNLDLCDSVAAVEAGLFGDNYYNAIAQLMAVQARRKTPWLLFLTTRVGNSHVHAETLSIFRAHYLKNLGACPPFKQQSFEAFKIGDEDSLAAALKTATGLHKVFLTGVCKWLLALALGHHSSIEVKSVLGYRVDKSASTTDLVSLAIRFSPHTVPVVDPFKLADVKSNLPDECTLSVRALKRVAKHLDVDQLMAENNELREGMIGKMAQLLEAARYDVAAYAAWVAAQE